MLLATVVSFLLIIAFFAVSKADFFVTYNEIIGFALTINSLENAFLHVFVHSNIIHLATNILFFFAFCYLTEQQISTRKVLFLMLISAAIPSLLFIYYKYFLFNELVALIGFSSVVYGLIGFAIVKEPKKAIAIFIVLSLLTLFFAVPLLKQLLQKKEMGVEKQIINVEQRIKETKDETLQESLKKELTVLKKEIDKIERSKQFSKSVTTDAFLHLFSLLLGAAFAFLTKNEH